MATITLTIPAAIAADVAEALKSIHWEACRQIAVARLEADGPFSHLVADEGALMDKAVAALRAAGAIDGKGKDDTWYREAAQINVREIEGEIREAEGAVKQAEAAMHAALGSADHDEATRAWGAARQRATHLGRVG